LEVLMHHADPTVDRFAWAGKAHGLPLQADRSVVSVIQAVDDIHQRGFARAVFTEQRQNFATMQGQADLIVRQNARKAFGHAVEFKYDLLLIKR